MIREAVPEPEMFGETMSPYELVAWRKARHVTGPELAAILGVTHATVYRWENSQRPVPHWLHLALRGIDEVMRLSRIAAAPPSRPRAPRRLRGSA